MSRKCVNNPNLFCYVCGEFTPKSQRNTITPLVKKAYELYFGSKVDEGKSWAPGKCCCNCSRSLRGWLNGTHKSMPFGNPVIWREQKDHTTDCYFCLTNIILNQNIL